MKSGLYNVVAHPLIILTLCLTVASVASAYTASGMPAENDSTWSLNHPGASDSVYNEPNTAPTTVQPISYQGMGPIDYQTGGYENVRLANRFSPENAVIGDDPLEDLYYETTSSASPVLPISQQIAAGGTSVSCQSTPTKPNKSRLGSMFCRMWHDICSDYCNYYSCKTLYDISIAIAIAAPFANTKADASFQNWYQEDIRSSGTDNFSSFWKEFGEGKYLIPAAAGVWLLCEYYDFGPRSEIMGEWGGRTTRAYLVGAIPLLFTQYMLGGGRPGEHSVGSQWRPFHDCNAVSGHAFMGAVPFITAAKMAKRPLTKGILYACSTFTAFSRVNDDDHYLTQICLGWWMAYVACNNVEKSELAKSKEKWSVEMQPLLSPGMSGVGVTISH